MKKSEISAIHLAALTIEIEMAMAERGRKIGTLADVPQQRRAFEPEPIQITMRGMEPFIYDGGSPSKRGNKFTPKKKKRK